MSDIKTPNHWKPGSKLQVTSVLSEGIARRFMGYCAEEERNYAGAIRLAVKRLLEEAGH